MKLSRQYALPAEAQDFPEALHLFYLYLLPPNYSASWAGLISPILQKEETGISVIKFLAHSPQPVSN